MPQWLGGPELIVIAILIVILFGWKKLPDAARSVGRSMRIFKAEVEEMKSAASTDTVSGETRRDERSDDRADHRRDDRDEYREGYRDGHRDERRDDRRDTYRDADRPTEHRDERAGSTSHEAHAEPAHHDSPVKDEYAPRNEDSQYRPPMA